MFQSTIIAILLFLTLNTIGQTKTSIDGKWKLIKMSDEEMTMNMKTDSLLFSDELNEKMTPEKDSTDIKKQTQAMMNAIFSNCVMIFKKDGSFLQFFIIGSDTTVDRGTYTIDQKNRGIYTLNNETNTLKSTPGPKKNKTGMHFFIKGKELHMDLAGESNLRAVFEKVN
jgi:hypothetical protein